MPMQIIRNDLTKMKVDAIVNPSNVALKMGGGVSGAILAAAGAEQLQAECDRIGKCGVGEAVITSGYDLPCKYIIHTVGPIWNGGNSGEAQLLRNAYLKSLDLASKHKIKSIAIPLVSSGTYGYPKDQALQIAIAAIGEFLLTHEIKVYLVVYDQKAFLLSEKIFSNIEKYIDDNYVDESSKRYQRRSILLFEIQDLDEVEMDYLPYAAAKSSRLSGKSAQAAKGKRNLKEVIGQLDESFSEMLLRLIDNKGMTDVETYKRANLDRRLFSKIRTNKDYNPSKPTAIALAIALQLNLDETTDLLGRAGYTLSHSSRFDLIIEYFIRHEIYNIYDINEALFDFGQHSLGA